jgi:hypothetical protein
VSDFYDLDRANARLPQLRQTLLGLQSMREELISLRDRIVDLNAPALAGGPSTMAARSLEVRGETQRLQMRMQGLVDQMQAAVVQIDDWGIQLREIQTGLVDFPALISGRPVWLCWRLTEERVEWWHEMTTGFDGRQRIEDMH